MFLFYPFLKCVLKPCFWISSKFLWVDFFWFMLFQQCVRLYELWSKIKEDKKEEHHQYLKERVSLQHEIIKRQDRLFEIHQAKIEQKQLQVWCVVCSISTNCIFHVCITHHNLVKYIFHKKQKNINKNSKTKQGKKESLKEMIQKSISTEWKWLQNFEQKDYFINCFLQNKF